MDAHLIQQAHKVLSGCGFVHQDRGGSYVPIEKKFLLPMVLAANQSLVFTKEITGQTVWGWRAISCDQGKASVTGVRIQIQLPNGRFLFGANGMDVGQFAWVGSFRFLLPEEIDCEPGSKISVSLSDDNTGGLANSLPVNLVLEGCYKYYLSGGSGPVDGPMASDLPRYFGTVNENILAPCWRQGYGPNPPAGFADGNFTYSSPVILIPLAGPVVGSVKIDIDNAADFVCNRVLFDLLPDSTVTAGSVLARLRTGDGYALSDDYLDYPRLIAGAEFPIVWKIRSHDEVVVELALVDAAGTGNMSVQVHLEGANRRPV